MNAYHRFASIAAGTLRSWRIGAPPLNRLLIIATATQRTDSIGVQEVASLLRGIIQSNAQESDWEIVRSGVSRPPKGRGQP